MHYYWNSPQSADGLLQCPTAGTGVYLGPVDSEQSLFSDEEDLCKQDGGCDVDNPKPSKVDFSIYLLPL